MASEENLSLIKAILPDVCVDVLRAALCRHGDNVQLAVNAVLDGSAREGGAAGAGGGGGLPPSGLPASLPPPSFLVGGPSSMGGYERYLPAQTPALGPSTNMDTPLPRSPRASATVSGLSPGGVGSGGAARSAFRPYQPSRPAPPAESVREGGGGTGEGEKSRFDPYADLVFEPLVKHQPSPTMPEVGRPRSMESIGSEKGVEADGESQASSDGGPTVVDMGYSHVDEVVRRRKGRGKEHMESATELSVWVRIRACTESRPVMDVQHQIEAVIESLGVVWMCVEGVGAVPRADYEERAHEWRVRVVLEMKDGDAQLTVSRWVRGWSARTANGLHDQLMMHVTDMHTVYDTISPQHSGFALTWLGIGHCPSPGMFFVRGDYVTNFNKPSNCQMSGGNNTTQFLAAGCQNYLSFASFEHDRRVVTCYFAVAIPPMHDGLQFVGYRVVLQYSNMVSVCVDCSDREDYRVIFRLKHPPQLWEAIPRAQNGRRVLNMEQNREWVRVLKWAGERDRAAGCSQEALATCPYLGIAIKKRDTGVETFGNASGADDERLRQLFELITRIGARSNAKVWFGAVLCVRRSLPHVPDWHSSVGSFRADYALKALISRGCVVTDELFEWTEGRKRGVEEGEGEEEAVMRTPFFKRVRWCMKECRQACEDSLENLLCAVDERRQMSVRRAFDKMYASKVSAYRRLARGEVKDTEFRRQLPPNCVMVRKVMVTPLRTLFMAPEVMMTNRVVRHFGEENALRCVFRDDSGGKMIVKDFVQGNNHDQQSPLIADMVQRTMSHGLRIHDRHYYFLAWSNSQMRDHGCYMYAPAVDPHTGRVTVDIEQMRSWMGDFSTSRNVPKLMSRMGQCFTQAQPTVLLSRREWRVDPDIEGGEGHPDTGETYCFSDGCGRMAPSLARRVAAALQLEIVPSCFQVRFKGFKGVVSIDPELEWQPDGAVVVFRKSQQKFLDPAEDDDTVLEVVKYAMPSPVCLNRPLITILDQVSERQGVALHARLCRKIHSYLEKELSNLAGMLLSEREAALGLTQRLSLPIDFTRLNACGFSLTDEPFFRRLLVAVYRYNISQHLSKAKIFLPPHMGRSMYGIVDETGLLQYGQVFIQYSSSVRKSSDKPVLYTGRVLVTKNPCHVAGDVRMFDAVWQPALSHLFDVIVFPRWGPRPHPDQMAGSDLDGDEYCVMFDPDLFFDHNEEPMVFPKQKPEEFDTTPTTEDMVDFFLKYLRQDSIGRMSNAHINSADWNGLFSEVSNEIARKCSVAVDFPKSGIPAAPLERNEQCEGVPDYMYNPVKPMYRSRRLNGQLYRKAKRVEEIVESTERDVETGWDDKPDPVLLPPDSDPFEGDEGLRRQSEMLRDEYAGKIQQLLDEYGITDEAAVVSGHMITLKRLAAMEKDDYSFYHTDKIVELRYQRIFDYYRKMFFEEFGGEDEFSENDGRGDRVVRTDCAMERKARAWYAVAYAAISSRSRRGRRATRPLPCRSFPWIVWDVLAAYKRTRLLQLQESTVVPPSPLADRLTDKVVSIRDRFPDEWSIYRAEVEHDVEPVARYARAYGPMLINVLFALNRWLVEDPLFCESRVSMEHVARLFIRWGLGRRCGGERAEDEARMAESVGENVRVFTQQLPPPCSSPSSPPLVTAMPPPGPVLIAFVRFLSSQQFALCGRVDLSIDGREGPVLLRPCQWQPLHHAAFKALHTVAITGRLDALRLGEEREGAADAVSMECEARDPLIVSAELFSDNNQMYNRRLALRVLQEWSGVSQLMARDLGHGRRNELIVTSVGSVAARQKLARLLLIPVQRLKQAIREDKIPTEAIIDTL